VYKAPPVLEALTTFQLGQPARLKVTDVSREEALDSSNGPWPHLSFPPERGRGGWKLPPVITYRRLGKTRQPAHENSICRGRGMKALVANIGLVSNTRPRGKQQLGHIWRHCIPDVPGVYKRLLGTHGLLPYLVMGHLH